MLFDHKSHKDDCAVRAVV